MLARRTCQRVVDKPSLACTALLATVYRSFFNNFLLYIYIHTARETMLVRSRTESASSRHRTFTFPLLSTVSRAFFSTFRNTTLPNLFFFQLCVIIYLQIVNSSISSNYISRFIPIHHIFNYWNRDSTCLFHVKNSLFHSLDNGGETRENPREKRKGKGRRQDKAR